MKLKSAAAIITVIVAIFGVALISPLFLIPSNVEVNVEVKQRVMITFSVLESANVVEWCNNLSSILNTYDLPATVFVVGAVAVQYPQAVSYFSDKVDIGSQTYSNRNLTSISDYSLKLEEVIRGKAAVDNAGHLNSKVFRAPYGATDQDIYSLLTRADILADFSYENQYNVYINNQFIKFDATTIKARDYPPDFFLTRTKTSVPLIIDFDNTYSTSSIDSFLSRLKLGNFAFVSASELVGITLTSRGSPDIARTELPQSKVNLERDEERDSQGGCEHLLPFFMVGR